MQDSFDSCWGALEEPTLSAEPDVRTRRSRLGRPPRKWLGQCPAQRTDAFRNIYLTHGKIALVDASDYEWLNQWTWTAMLAKSGWYAVRGGQSKHIRMHRLITAAPDGTVVDHEDGDGLNNTRANLRVCSNAENMRNSGLRSSNKSGFKGVFWNRRSGRWMARITVDYKTVHIGCFATGEAAARAYDIAALELHGPFARTNFGAVR